MQINKIKIRPVANDGGNHAICCWYFVLVLKTFLFVYYVIHLLDDLFFLVPFTKIFSLANLAPLFFDLFVCFLFEQCMSQLSLGSFWRFLTSNTHSQGVFGVNAEWSNQTPAVTVLSHGSLAAHGFWCQVAVEPGCEVSVFVLRFHVLYHVWPDFPMSMMFSPVWTLTFRQLVKQGCNKDATVTKVANVISMNTVDVGLWLLQST